MSAMPLRLTRHPWRSAWLKSILMQLAILHWAIEAKKLTKSTRKWYYRGTAMYEKIIKKFINHQHVKEIIFMHLQFLHVYVYKCMFCSLPCMFNPLYLFIFFFSRSMSIFGIWNNVPSYSTAFFCKQNIQHLL
jgi:hypothetical protein